MQVPHHSRGNIHVVSEDYPWADLTVDLSRHRGDDLPLRLPPPLPGRTATDPTTGEQVSVHICPRHKKRKDSKAKPHSDLVYIHTAADGRRTGFVIYQGTSDSAIVGQSLRREFVFYHHSAPWQRSEDPYDVHAAIRRMGVWAQQFRDAHESGMTKPWDMAEVRSWLTYFTAGVTTVEERAVLEEAGFNVWDSYEPDTVLWLRTVEKIPVSEIAYWWKKIAHRVIPDVVTHNLTYEDLAPYRGTPLDPFDRQQDASVLSARIKNIAEAGGDWDAKGRSAVLESRPDGCVGAVWVDMWTRFMSPVTAGLYARAGYSFEEAVRCETTGGGPGDEALAMMVALQEA